MNSLTPLIVSDLCLPHFQKSCFKMLSSEGFVASRLARGPVTSLYWPLVGWQWIRPTTHKVCSRPIFTWSRRGLPGWQKLCRRTSTQSLTLVRGRVPSHCPLGSCVMRSVQRSSRIPSQESMQNVLRILTHQFWGGKWGRWPTIPSAAHQQKSVLLYASLLMCHFRCVPQQNY